MALTEPIIQIVPTPFERKARYDAYLLTPHWRNLRFRLFRSRGHQCQACSRDGKEFPIDAHHLVYRDPLESGMVDDLMGLCRRCHELAHTMRPFQPNCSPLERFSATRAFIRRALGIRNDRPENPKKLKKGRTARRQAIAWATQIRKIERAKVRRNWSF